MMQEPEFRTGVIKPVEVYREAWEMMKPEFWTIFGISLIAILVGSIIPFVIVGPMMCGLYLCLIDKVDGKPAAFDKLFKGFDFFLPSLIVTIFIAVPMIVLMFVIYIPMIGMAITGPRMGQTELMGFIVGVFVFEVILAIVMVAIHSLILFAFPLIADRGIGGLEAIKLSARAVLANKGGIAGLFGVGFVVILIGYLMLCIGVYLVIPLIFMATTVAYRKIFPPIASHRFEPPLPGRYSSI